MNIYELKLATSDDTNDILSIYNDGIKSLKNDNVNQWQNNESPNLNTIMNHLNTDLFVFTQNNTIIATCVLQKGIDPCYEKFKWHSNLPYISIHKVAIKKEFQNKGLSKIMFNKIESYAIKNNIFNLRIDTHENNFRMKNLLSKCNYKFTEKIIFNDSLIRIGFDKILSNLGANNENIE